MADTTPAPKPKPKNDLTGREAQLDKLRAELAASFLPPEDQAPAPAATTGTLVIPNAAQLELPDVNGARAALRTAVGRDAEARYGFTQQAQQYLTETMAPFEVPPPISAEPSLGESFNLSMLPHVVRDDQRPPTVADRQRAAVHQAVRGLASPIEIPLRGVLGTTGSAADALVPDVRSVVPGMAEFREQNMLDRLPANAAGAISDPRPTDPEELRGLEAEDAALALMRVIGTLPSAMSVEAIERLPAGIDVGKTKANVRSAETFADYVNALDVAQVGDWFGVSPGHNQQVRRPFVAWEETPMGVSLPIPGADYLQGVLERVERGEGFEKDAENAVASTWGDTKIPGTDTKVSDVGWWLGFGVDTLTNWEGMLAAGPKAAAAFAKRAEVAAKLGVPGNGMQRAVDAISNNAVDFGDMAARTHVQRLETGAGSTADLPPGLRPYLAEVARAQSMTPDELARADGILTPDPVPDEKFLASTEAARSEAQGRMAQVTGAERGQARAEQVAAQDAAAVEQVQATMADQVKAAEQRLADVQAEYQRSKQAVERQRALELQAHEEAVARHEQMVSDAQRAEEEARSAEQEAVRLAEQKRAADQLEQIRAANVDLEAQRKAVDTWFYGEKQRLNSAVEQRATQAAAAEDAHRKALDELVQLVDERHIPDNEVRIVEGKPKGATTLPQRPVQMTPEEWWPTVPPERQQLLHGLEARVASGEITMAQAQSVWADTYARWPAYRVAPLTAEDFATLPAKVRSRMKPVLEGIRSGSMPDAEARARLTKALEKYRDTGGSTPSATRKYSPEVRHAVSVLATGLGDPRQLYRQLNEAAMGMRYQQRQELLKVAQQAVAARLAREALLADRARLTEQLGALAAARGERLAPVQQAAKELQAAERAAVETQLAARRVAPTAGGTRLGQGVREVAPELPTVEALAAAERRAQVARGRAAELADQVVQTPRPEPPAPRTPGMHQALQDRLLQAQREVEGLQREQARVRALAFKAEQSARRAGEAAMERHAALASLPDVESPSAVPYVVRNAHGDVPVGAVDTLEEALVDFADRRRIEGDELWASNTRPLVMWRSTGSGRGVLHAVGPMREAERKVFERVAASVGEVDLRPAAGRAERAVGAALAEATGLPMGSRYTPRTRFGLAVRDAFRMWATDNLGASELKSLPGTGALVSRRDYTQIMGQVNGRLDDAFGVRGRDLREVLAGKVELTPDRMTEVRRLARQWGYRYPIDRLDATTYRELMRAGVEYHGGILASARSRIRGTPGMADALQDTLAAFSTDKRKSGKLVQAARRIPWVGDLLTSATDALFEDKFVDIPERVKRGWKQLQIRLERDPHLFLKDLKRAEGLYLAKTGTPRWKTVFRPVDMAAVIADVLPTYNPVTRADVELAGRIEQALATGMDLDVVHADLLRTMGGPDNAPGWVNVTSPTARNAALVRWMEDQQRIQSSQALDYLTGLVLSTNDARSLSGSLVGDVLKTIPDAQLRKVYNELWMDGVIGGPEALSVVRKVTNAPVDDAVGLAMYILTIRRQQILRDGVSDLVRETGAVIDATHKEAIGEDVLLDTLLDKHRTWDAERGRYVYHHPEGAIAWAERTLTNLGYQPGATYAGETPLPINMKAGDRNVVVPAPLKAHLEAVLGAGDIRGASSKAEHVVSAYDNITRLWKMTALGGLIFPNPRYYVAQALSLLPTVATELGPSGTARLGKTVFTEAPLVAELVRRLNTDGTPLFRNRDPRGWMVETARGEWYTVDELEEAARRWGLEDTIYDFEVGEQLRDFVVRQEDPSKLRALRMTASAYQDTLRNVGGVADQAMRLAVFIDAVKAGQDLPAAAALARKAVLDFRALSSFESKYLRRAYLFYAFMRKNSDQFVRNLVRNPNHVTSQMRLAHAAITRGRTNAELSQTKDRELARQRVWFNPDPVIDAKGRLHPEYTGVMLSTSPMGVMDQMAGFSSFTDPESISPPLAAAWVFVTKNTLSGDPLDSQRRNQIPPVLVDLLSQGPLMDLFKVGPEPIAPWEDEIVADDEASAILGQPAIWMAGGGVVDDAVRARAQANWRAFITLAGPEASSAQNFLRAAQVMEPRPGLQADDETFSWATGLRPSLVKQPSAFTNAAARQMQRRIEAATENVVPPPGTR